MTEGTRLTSVCRAVGGELRGDGAVCLEGVAFDSRRVRAGELYCCVPGGTADGHAYASQAVRAGAVALLVEHPVDVLVPQVVVGDVRRAMGPAAALVYGEPSRRLRLVGITGTNGKTTTAYMLTAIATAAGCMPCMTGTVETRIGVCREAVTHTTPEAPDVHALLARMADAGCDVTAMEVSSHALAQHRVGGVHFAVACFTNLSQDHLDYHGTMHDYFQAKRSLFSPMYADSAVVGVDDLWGASLVEACRAEKLQLRTFSARPATLAAEHIDPARHVWVEVQEATPARLTLHLAEGADEIDVSLQIGGVHNARNAACAVAAARQLDIAWKDISAGLEALSAVPGRFEPIEAGQPFTVVIDYAHSPDGIDNVLRAARRVLPAGATLRIVMGCGGDRDRAKRPLMGRAAGELADHVIVTSDNPRSEDQEAIIDEIVSGLVTTGVTYERILDRRDAIRAALVAARPCDVVVVAGKGHEPYQEVAGVRHPFSDRDVAVAELAALGYGEVDGSEL